MVARLVPPQGLQPRPERDQKIAFGLTLHGRRHTLGDELANLGADPWMIQAVLGHRSMAASLHCSAGADPVDVIGTALGSLVGALLAIRHPARVRQMMMCAVAPEPSGARMR